MTAPALVRIGPHTLICGDARDHLASVPFDVLCTDPPYEFAASGGGQYRAARPNGLDAIEAAGLHEGFDQAWLINALWQRQIGGAAIFCHNDQLDRLMAAMRTPFRRVAALGWHKTNPQPVANKHYLPDLEFILHGWNAGFHPRPGPEGLGSMKRIYTSAGGRNQFGHPTQKPIEVMVKVLVNLGGSVVCDPFMGTGSTGVAAAGLGRTFVGIERERKWFDVAVARMREAVGDQQPATKEAGHEA